MGEARGGAGDGAAGLVPVWDLWVRLFHWSLVAAVSFQIASGLTGWQFFDWHRRVGELVLALVLFRLLWGIVGSDNARLATLVRHPRAAVAHLGGLLRREAAPERRHNAAGAWAVLAMLVLLAVQALSGMFIADEDEFIEGAWYGTLDEGTSALLFRIHHLNAQLLEILVVVHVSMIVIYLLWARRNLVLPMLSGRMRWPAGLALPPLRLRGWPLGVPLVLLSLGVVGYLSGWFG